jgi:uncharacterized membrane protein YoaK (UPF0700 family)
MNKEKAISLVSAALTINLILVIGGLMYLYFKNREYFKWAFFSLLIMIVVVVMYSFTKKMLSEIFNNK